MTNYEDFCSDKKKQYFVSIVVWTFAVIIVCFWLLYFLTDYQTTQTMLTIMSIATIMVGVNITLNWRIAVYAKKVEKLFADPRNKAIRNKEIDK